MSEILKRIIEAEFKGKLLEDLVVDILCDVGLKNVEKQKSGSQYGYDVIGYKQEPDRTKCWKVECKNLKSEITINTIAPKLIWYINNSNIDKFIIVSVNGISNDVRLLLETKPFSFPVEVWYGDYLEKIIFESPRAMKRLELTQPNLTLNHSAQPIIFPQSELKFGVVYSNNIPFSFDYFILNGQVIKAFTEFDFKLTGTITNETLKTFFIQKVLVKTIRYEKTNRMRVLRQFTQRGLITPIKLTFIPPTKNNSCADLIEGKLLEIKSGSNEYINFKLSRKCEPGYYELMFEVHCVEGNRTFTLYSPVFLLHKPSTKHDKLDLCVLNTFYDSPSENILQSDFRMWQKLNEYSPNCIKFLGPSMNDNFEDFENKDTWTVNLLKGKMDKTGLSVSPKTKSKAFIDLKIPIEEKLCFRDDLMDNI